MAVIETDPKKIKEKPQTEIIGEFSLDDIGIKEPIVENVEDNAQENPTEEMANENVEGIAQENSTEEMANENVEGIAQENLTEEMANENVEGIAQENSTEEMTNENAESIVQENSTEEPTVKENQVVLAVNALTLDLNEKGINTASKQGTVGEKKSFSKEQYQQAIRDEICPEPGVYDKSKIIQNVSTIEKANEEGMFKDAGTLLVIMQENNIPLPQQNPQGGMQNLIIRDGAEYTILFTETPEKMQISSAEMAAHRDDILNARNIEELKDKLAEKGNIEKGNDKSVENVNSIHHSMQMEQDGMDIGSR